MDVFVFLREYLQEVDAPDESLFVVYLDVGHDDLGEVDVGLVERREDAASSPSLGGIVEVNARSGVSRSKRCRKKLARKWGTEMRRSRSFVERSAITRNTYIKCESKVYLSFGTEIAIRKPYEIDK